MRGAARLRFCSTRQADCHWIARGLALSCAAMILATNIPFIFLCLMFIINSYMLLSRFFHMHSIVAIS
jgi:hypothetical protein